MKPESHMDAFNEYKETIFKWALRVRGLGKSQRIVGLNASRGAVELLSTYLHQKSKARGISSTIGGSNQSKRGSGFLSSSRKTCL